MYDDYCKEHDCFHRLKNHGGLMAALHVYMTAVKAVQSSSLIVLFVLAEVQIEYLIIALDRGSCFS